MSAPPRLSHGPAVSCTGVHTGERLPAPAALGADERRRVRQATCSAEIEQVGQLLDALLREGVKVEVRAGTLIVNGEPCDLFGQCAIETLTGRERAVERALVLAAERAPDFAALLAERRAAAGKRRIARKPRTRRMAGDVPVPVERPVEQPVEQPVGTGGGCRLDNGGKAGVGSSLPSVSGADFSSLDREPR